MAKLVVLSEGLAGRVCELAAPVTTIGRIEDNAFELQEPSVSSHHCQVELRGADVVVKDLNSTNGTYVNGQKVEGEAVLRPGQTLRLGQVELRFESDQAPAPVAKKPTSGVTQGVSLTSLDQGTKQVTFDKNSPFSKKSNAGSKLFLIVAVVVGLALIGVIAWLILQPAS